MRESSPIRMSIDHKHIVNERWDILVHATNVFFDNAQIKNKSQQQQIINIITDEIKYCSTGWRVPGWKQCKHHVLFFDCGMFSYGMYNAMWEPIFSHTERLNEPAP